MLNIPEFAPMLPIWVAAHGPAKTPTPTSALTLAVRAARMANIRCGASRRNVPRDKHAQWRDIKITFGTTPNAKNNAKNIAEK